MYDPKITVISTTLKPFTCKASLLGLFHLLLVYLLMSLFV